MRGTVLNLGLALRRRITWRWLRVETFVSNVCARLGQTSYRQLQPKRRGRLSRAGLSIMEVLFAIGVLTIGLLGVASILPVATFNAAKSIKTDRAVEEFNNRVASDVAKISDSFNDVVIANNSLNAFQNAPPNDDRRLARLINVSTAEFGARLATYDYTTPSQPVLPDAFCIDPWFLGAASALRDDVSDPVNARNGYDRTMFPCYDPRLHPLAVPPSEPIGSSLGPAPAYNALVDLPRFTRVGLAFNGTSLLAAINTESEIRRSDDFSIYVPKDTTQGAGLFIQRGGNAAGSLAKNTVSSRYSSIVTMARSAIGSNLFNAAVITIEDREVVTVPVGTFNGHVAGQVAAQNMRPYVPPAWLPDDPAYPNSFPTDATKLYGDETIGYVNAAPRPIAGGGGGEFRFRTNRYVKPDVRDGDWLMLMRREYVRTPGTTAITPGVLKYAWYRVTDVIQAPTLTGPNLTDPYETHVSVDGPDWVFHPIQTEMIIGGVTYYAPPYFSTTTQPSWSTAPAFNLDDMPATGTDPAAPPTYNHFNYGTVVVLMPRVISVKQFQVRL